MGVKRSKKKDKDDNLEKNEEVKNISEQEILSLERKPTAIQSTPTEYQLPQGIMYLPWKI